jgi:FAD/FMN-containing dehydrogenase
LSTGAELRILAFERPAGRRQEAGQMEEPTRGTVPATRVDLERLGREFVGTVLTAEDPGYAEARRVWNGMIDRHPVAIARAASADDVAVAIRFSRESDLPLAVRGGGHSVAGNGTVDAGLVLDLGQLRTVSVNDQTRTVTVQAGATLADIDRATVPQGLAVPMGVVSATGIAGLTLGGGIGWLTRAYGLTIDNLHSADMVTAAGERVRASERQNADLFWGLRGGGGNFGVVTSFEFQAYPIPPRVYAGNLIYTPAQWRTALAAYARWTAGLPDELTSILTFLTPPGDWGMGEEPSMIIGFVWATDDERRAAQLVDRLRQDAPPDFEETGPTPWTAWQSSVDATFPRGSRAYWKNVSFDALDDAVVDVLLARAAEQTWVGTGFDVHHLGGTFGRMPEESTAFPNRSAQFWLNIYGFWTEPDRDEPHRAFIRALAADMEPFAAGGRYVNFLAEETGSTPVDRARDTYGPGKLRRLAQIKQAWDPDNVFRLNHNIQPGQSLR